MGKNKVFILLVIGFVTILFLGLFIKNYKSKEKEITKESALSTFIPIDFTKTIEKINDQDQFILYIGYEACSACQTFTPNLIKAQQNLKFITYYLDFKALDRTTDEWKNFAKLLIVKQTLNFLNDDKEITTVTDTIGNFLTNKGYTPVMLAFKDGKLVDGYIGTMSEKNIENWIQETNFKF